MDRLCGFVSGYMPYYLKANKAAEGRKQYGYGYVTEKMGADSDSAEAVYQRKEKQGVVHSCQVLFEFGQYKLQWVEEHHAHHTRCCVSRGHGFELTGSVYG